MKLRCKVPLSTYVLGHSAEALNLESQFKHDDISVKLKLMGEKSLAPVEAEKDKLFICKVNSISLFIEEVEIDVKESEYPKLLRFLTPIINRVFRNIRNFGTVAHVNEIYPEDQDAEHYLWRWAVEISEDGKSWQNIVTDEPWKYFFYMQRTEPTGELRSSNWPDIEEAIQDNLAPPPEQEFVINAIEYLRNRNYRMALLESIICLEIVLNQHLSKYLSINMKISKGRINKFLSPQLGLTARVSALLNLCLHSKDVKQVEFNNVLKAINWRNHIIHKTGHLPKDLPEGTIYQNINSVLNLVLLLAQRRNQIETSPDMQQIGKNISEKHDAPIPNIWLVDRHRFLVEFVFYVIPSDFPEVQVLEALALEASTQLSARDRRFNPQEHLYIRYYSFRDLKALWYKGSLHIVQTTQDSDRESVKK